MPENANVRPITRVAHYGQQNDNDEARRQRWAKIWADAQELVRRSEETRKEVIVSKQ